MHRQLRELLHDATGTSGFVVAVFLDVRGFSSFARLAESSEAAVFLRRMYTRILDDYFSEADFFKPTGDGLMIVRSCDGSNVADISNHAVATSLSLVNDFSSLCDGDPMVNFATPDALGIGIARGAATRLDSSDLTLDYSGRPLNLAARLMDIARPSGVVFDQTFGPDLLDAEILSAFAPDSVYIKGIAEDEPITIWHTPDWTVVGEGYRTPPLSRTWHIQQQVHTLRELEERGSFLVKLEKEPRATDEIEFVVRHPKSRGGKRHPKLTAVNRFGCEYLDEAGFPYVRVDFSLITPQLRAAGVKGPWPVTTTVRYLV